MIMGLNGQSLCLRMWLLCFCAVRGGIVSIVELGAIQDDTGVVAARVNGQVLWRVQRRFSAQDERSRSQH